jgi:hypothetical protein
MAKQLFNPLEMPQGVRYEVVFQAKSGATDANGERQYQKVFACMAIVATQGSKEVYFANQLSGQATHVITMRYPRGVQIVPGMQALTLGKVLSVQVPAENVMNRNLILKVTCVEVNDGAVSA